MIDITPLLNALIAVAAVLITVFLIPWIKSRTTTAQRENIQEWVKIGCAAAEQLYNSGQIQNKKAYVLQYWKSIRSGWIMKRLIGTPSWRQNRTKTRKRSQSREWRWRQCRRDKQALT